MMRQEIGDFAAALYSAANLGEAFTEFERQVQQLGFSGALYTHIPDVVLVSDEGQKPVFQLSEAYAPNYVAHYQEARYDKVDPLIQAVAEGVSSPIHWSGHICERYMSRDKRSREVIQESHSYGIREGITLPLRCNTQGIAGASFINTEAHRLSDSNKCIEELTLVTSLYHNLVSANAGYMGNFIRPIFGDLNDLEIRFVAGLAAGKSLKDMAEELCRSRKYLEQVLVRIRVKVSGEDENGKPQINRDQLLYYAGLINVIGIADGIRGFDGPANLK